MSSWVASLPSWMSGKWGEVLLLALYQIDRSQDTGPGLAAAVAAAAAWTTLSIPADRRITQPKEMSTPGLNDLGRRQTVFDYSAPERFSACSACPSDGSRT